MCGNSKQQQDSKFQVGDRVEIVSSPFKEHPSRMAGGTGTVKSVWNNVCGVIVDNGPDHDHEWFFNEDGLKALEMIIGAYESHETGRRVSLPLGEDTK